MKCPHCLVEYHHEPTESFVGEDINGGWKLLTDKCPACKRHVFEFKTRKWKQEGGGGAWEENQFLVYPKHYTARPISEDVPKDFADDFNEAVLVLPYSPKASAALSRRCLQHILREKGGFTARTLDQEI